MTIAHKPQGIAVKFHLPKGVGIDSSCLTSRQKLDVYYRGDIKEVTLFGYDGMDIVLCNSDATICCFALTE